MLINTAFGVSAVKRVAQRRQHLQVVNLIRKRFR
jgi:hypothetical protein